MRSSVNAPAHPAPSTVQQPVSPLGALTDASGVETRRASVDHFIPNCYAVGFLAGARSKGVDLPSMMLRHGIMPSLQESPASRISLDRFANLLARLGRHMRDESVGLASRPVKPGTFGLVAAQMVRCATLHEALQLGFKMYRLAIDDFSAHLRIEADGSAHVVLHERAPDVHHAFLDAVFLYWTLGLASWLIQQRIPARDLLLHADAPVMPYQELDHLFGVPIRFEAPLSCLVIDAQWLAQPVLADAPSLQEFLRAAPANLLVRYRDRSSDSEQVRLRLHRLLGGVLPSLEQMAWSMKMTPHSLRRRLFDEGKSFQGIKNDLRRDAAIDLLTHSSLTLADIAQQLGFSEPSTFHRSFKLWTGVAPGEYRQTHGGALAFSASANHRR